MFGPVWAHPLTQIWRSLRSLRIYQGLSAAPFVISDRSLGRVRSFEECGELLVVPVAICWYCSAFTLRASVDGIYGLSFCSHRLLAGCQSKLNSPLVYAEACALIALAATGPQSDQPTGWAWSAWVQQSPAYRRPRPLVFAPRLVVTGLTVSIPQFLAP
jgi:hypothetical protein